MTRRLTRHFVTVAGRRVHYTRAGDGPPVLMLHESPCAAGSLALAQGIYAGRFTAIAPDTPGYGLSDPLPLAQPEIADYADALALLLDALGIAQAAVYGRHTGASIAAEFAHRHPARCAMLLTAGLPVYSTAQRESRLGDYLRPLVPAWDGSHLLWLWFRYREQHVFWPWHDQVAERRADTDVPDLDFLHRGVLEFLDAGDGYRIAYAAAFRHGGTALGLAGSLAVPACFAAHEGDSLFRTLGLFPPGAWTVALPRDEAASSRAECDLLARHPANAAVPPPPAPDALPGRATLDMLDFGDHQVMLRSAGPVGAGAVPVLLLHHAPGSAAALEEMVVALGQHLPALAFDLPGCGESVPPSGYEPGIAAWAGTALAVLDRLGIARAHVYGHGGGAAVAVELAHRAPGRVASVTLDSPPALPHAERAAFAAAYAPSAMPEWDGSHLLRVWHHLRDQELWWPWHRRTRAAARPGPPDNDPVRLNARARACLKQPASYQAAWAAVLSYPLQDRIADLPGPVAVMAGEGDLFAHLAPAAAGAAGVPCRLVGNDAAARAACVRSHLPSG